MNSPTQDARRATSRSNTDQLRLFSLIEAATLIALLFIAVPLKHIADYPLAVSIVGPIHGLVFLIFGWLVAQSVGAGTIRLRTAGKLMLAASLPFGGLYSWWSLR